MVSGHEGCVRLAQDHGPSRLESLNDSGVALWDVLGEEWGSGRRPHAGCLESILDRAGDAVERPPPLAPGQGVVGRLGTPQGLVGAERHYGVDLRVKLLDAGQDVPGQFHGGDLLASDRPRGIERRGELQVDRLDGLKFGGGRRPDAMARCPGTEKGCETRDERSPVWSQFRGSHADLQIETNERRECSLNLSDRGPLA